MFQTSDGQPVDLDEDHLDAVFGGCARGDDDVDLPDIIIWDIDGGSWLLPHPEGQSAPPAG